MKVSKSKLKRVLTPDLIFVLILSLYPMRHIRWGLDLWDTGYNYANFTYMGTEHMDPMWLFATWLSNAIGHFMTLLPGAGSLAGMNFYTGLSTSALAVAGYWFCRKKLGIPRWIAFVGEMLALSLCWCPTAVLYNYITYVFFLGCVILLYVGLTEERSGCLFAAGLCLGCNVLARFSNLPEAAMIVAVWAWDVILWLERKKKSGGEISSRSDAGDSFLRSAARHTLWCLGGYLAALAALFGWIQIRYGIGDYIAGIRRLLAMTDNAQDYKVKSMIFGLVGTYVENLYWVARIGVIVALGIAGFAIAELAAAWAGRSFGESARRVEQGIRTAARILWGGVAVLMLVWLYLRNFYSIAYYTYGPVERPAVLFLMLVMLIGVIRVFHPGSPREEKLISGMVILVVLLTSIGSNNRVFPSMNNLFVAGPYALWECWRFARYVGDWRLGGKLALCSYPAKAVLAAFLAMVLFQSAVFGACFTFEEATGAQNISTVIDNNSVLRGIKMNPARAEWMNGLSAYVNERGLQGRELISFGQVPALSYYLQMPAAFNPWCDLRSYSYETMAEDLESLSGEMSAQGRARPVLIMERSYAQQYAWYLEGGDALLREQGVDGNRRQWIAETGKKYLLLREFAEKFNYNLTYENEKFLVYE